MLRQKSSSPLGRIGQVATPDIEFQALEFASWHRLSTIFPTVFRLLSARPERLLLQATFV